MATSKQLFFSKSVLGLQKRFSVLRRLATPASNGVEIAQNRDFSQLGVWTTGANITINQEAHRALFAYVSGTSLTQSVPDMVKSTWYRVQFDILEYQQGNVQAQCGNEGTPARAVGKQGRISIDVCSKGDNTLYITGVDAFAGTISNVSLQKLVHYEANWQDITAYTTNNTISGINRSLDYKSWEFGEVKQDNATLKLVNVYGEMSDEENEESIWHSGYVRHYSKIRIECSFDGKTRDVLFEGLLDDRTGYTQAESTQAAVENITAYSYTKLMSDITLSELGTLNGTTINDIVYDVMNRGFFTDYFTVSRAYIQAGVNATVNLTEFELGTKVVDLLKELAKGHSVFYVDTDGIFKFKPIEPNTDVAAEFGTFPERKLKVYDYRSGSERVIEKFYWEDSAEKFEVAVPKYQTSQTVKIKGINNTTDKQAIINFLGHKYSTKRASFKVDLPLCPFLKIMDRVRVEQMGAVDDAFVLNISRLDVGVLNQPVGAVRINPNTQFVIYAIKNTNTKTTLTLLEYKE